MPSYFHKQFTLLVANIHSHCFALLLRVHLFDSDMSWPPKFTKLEAELSDGTKFAFADARRFGKVVVQVRNGLSLKLPCDWLPIAEVHGCW